jgi:NADH-quinone oxidoreductase subunit E
MLTDIEREEIEREIAHAETRRAAALDVMKILQKHRGYVTDDGIRDLSELLDMSAAELDSLATFFNLIFRKPVGKHVILVCDSVSCWIVGYESVRAQLEKRLGVGLGQTTPDGLFTLLTIPCLGACDLAPAMMIGETLYGNLDPEKIDAILEEYRDKG